MKWEQDLTHGKHRLEDIDMNLNENKCACCGEIFVGLYDICEVCGWQDDLVQNKNPDYKGGANEMSLNEAKQAYKEGKEIY